MVQITAGYILYSEQSQPGTFGAPKAEARFDFGVEVGEDYEAIANKAANEAKRYVRRLIGLDKPAPAVATAPSAAATAVAAAVTATDAGAGAPVVNLMEQLKASVAATTAAPATEAKPRKPRAPKIEAAKEPVANDPAAALLSGEAQVSTDAEIDPALAAVMGTATPAARVITDKELQHEAAEAVKRLQPKNGAEAPKMVTALIYGYTGGPPKGLMSVPSEKREEFLTKLKALA